MLDKSYQAGTHVRLALGVSVMHADEPDGVGADLTHQRWSGIRFEELRDDAVFGGM